MRKPLSEYPQIERLAYGLLALHNNGAESASIADGAIVVQADVPESDAKDLREYGWVRRGDAWVWQC